MTTNGGLMRRLLVGVVAAVGLLAGCGGGGGGQASHAVPAARTEAAPATVTDLSQWSRQMLPLSTKLGATFTSLSEAERTVDTDRTRDVSVDGLAEVAQMRAVLARCPDEELASAFNAALDQFESAFNHNIAAADAFEGGDYASASIELRAGSSDLQAGSALEDKVNARLHELNAR